MLATLLLLVLAVRVLGTGSGGVLAFISDCGNESSVYVIDVSRHILLRLLEDTQSRLPRWDGQQLNLVEGRTFPITFYGANADVISADSPGFFLPSLPTEISNVWGQAPDGRWAMVMFRDNNYEIYVTDAGRQHAHRLTYNDCDDHYPRWQP